MAPEEVSAPTKKNKQSVEGPRPPSSRSQTEVAAPRRQLLTVPDVENRVIGVLRILGTKADSRSASSSAYQGWHRFLHIFQRLWANRHLLS